ncbi:MAG: hypothetical protein Q4D89_05260 [Arachnia propionica]|uniref:hypothetical protein n=1 Tax=Arachnia propionica TaxID=1750 RepID=UPI0027050A5D|nr:hypothetical protein [Arachnia propionica]
MTGRQSWWLIRGAVIAGVCALLALGSTVSLLWRDLGATDMADVIISARLFYPVWAVVTGWLACWVTAQHTPDSVLVGAAPGRARTGVLAKELGSTMIAVVVGVLAGHLPVVLVSMARLPWNLADLLALAALLTGVASLVAVGACGALVAGPRVGIVLAPLAAVVTVVAPAFLINDVLLLNRSMSVMSASYMWSVGGPGLGERLLWSTQLIQIMFFALVGFTAFKVAVGMAEVHAARNRRGWTALGWVAAPLVVMAFLAFQQPLLTEEDPTAEVRCENTGDLELCLYPKAEGERQFIAELMSPLVPPVAQGQRPYVISQGGPGARGHDHLGEVAGSRKEWGAVQVRSWAGRLLMTPAVECPQTALEDEHNVLHDVALARIRFGAGKVASPQIREIYDLVLDEGGQEAAVMERFAAFDDADWAAWVAAHQDGLDRCLILPEDLP